MTLALLIALVTTTPDAGLASCQTVSDCWLSSTGEAIARPAKFRGQSLPKGDCGRRILWLRHRLTCDAGLCRATFIGDKC